MVSTFLSELYINVVSQSHHIDSVFHIKTLREYFTSFFGRMKTCHQRNDLSLHYKKQNKEPYFRDNPWRCWFMGGRTNGWEGRRRKTTLVVVRPVSQRGSDLFLLTSDIAFMVAFTFVAIITTIMLYKLYLLDSSNRFCVKN